MKKLLALSTALLLNVACGSVFAGMLSDAATATENAAKSVGQGAVDMTKKAGEATKDLAVGAGKAVEDAGKSVEKAVKSN